MQTLRTIAAAAIAVAAMSMFPGRATIHARQGTAPAAGPVYIATFIDLTPPNTPAGTKAIQQYVADTKKDAGIVRIEAIAQQGRENHLLIYEVWQSQKAFDAHETLAHTRMFKTTLYPLMGAPFDQRVHHLV
jgi:quinol monooxygenase YgiN